MNFVPLLSIISLLITSSVLQASLLMYNVGSVKGEAVTSREVEVQAILDYILYRKKGKKLSLPLGKEDMLRETSTTLLEMTVYREAKFFQVASVPSMELKSIMRTFFNRLKKSKLNKYWESLQVSGKEVRQFLLAKLRAKKFIQFKRQSSQLLVSDEEVMAYYRKHRSRFPKLGFSRLKENIRNYLKKEQSEKKFSEWFQSLRKNHELRNFLLE